MAVETGEFADLDFEEAYRRLQDVVEQLERGNLPLQDSLALFETGTGLVRRCSAVLSQAELKITVLTKELDAEVNHERRRAGSFAAASPDDEDEA